MSKIIPNGKTVIVIKTRNVGPSSYADILPTHEYDILEGNKKYRVVEYLDGDVFWYINGDLHRELGPAIEFGNGTCSWYYRGHRMACSSQTEFDKLLRLKAFW